MVGPIASAEEITIWLEWSGSKLLSLRLAAPGPSGYKNNWPSYPSDSTIAYGYNAEKLRVAIPSAKEIALMDEFLYLPSSIRDQVTRGIVSARSMVTPLSARHLYSWRKLATRLHTNHKQIQRLYRKGVWEIGQKLSTDKTYLLRETFITLTS